MAQAQPVQQTPHGRAVHRKAALGQFKTKLIEGQIAILGHAAAKPVTMIAELTAAVRTALRLGGQ